MSATPPNPIGPTNDPDLKSLLSQMVQGVFYGLNCHQLGTIVSFDSTKQTAVVSINVLRTVPDNSVTPAVFKTVPYPQLLDLPVFIASGGTGALTFPITAGDTCLVLFNDRDIDTWFSTGGVSAPNSQRAHDLSDGLALVGFRSMANLLADYQTDRVRLAYGATLLDLKDKVRLLNADASLKSVLDAIITALTALDAKTGPSAAAAIALAVTQINLLTET